MSDSPTPPCKFCGATSVVRYGMYKGIQRFFCRSCKRKFADNNALPGMRVPLEVSKDAVSRIGEGMSYNKTRAWVLERHGIKLSTSTIHRWVMKGR